MELKSLYREILNEHNIHPEHKMPLDDATYTLQGVNPSCGDNITLYLKSENGKIVDGGFTGSGCAVSQASVDMMLDLVIGKDEREAVRLCGSFTAMIRGEASEAQIEELEEAGALQDVSHMPSRVKCALLGWRTMNDMLSEQVLVKTGTLSHCDVK